MLVQSWAVFVAVSNAVSGPAVAVFAEWWLKRVTTDVDFGGTEMASER